MIFSFCDDYYRMTGRKLKLCDPVFYKEFIFHHNLRYMFYLRCVSEKKFRFLTIFFKVNLFRLSRKFGIEIKPETVIGRGLSLVHPYNITISPHAQLGKNINVAKGATIGFSAGKNRGAPVIGDNVQIGINSTVTGNIKIGNHVLIAPNAFVNEDIPDNSVVIGNPCKIIHKENAPADYVGFLV